jgi:pyridoxal phosphate phosphatase PHOSPHO2
MAASLVQSVSQISLLAENILNDVALPLVEAVRQAAIATVVAAQQPQPRQRALMVFDFDWSLVDEDSDTFVISQLSPVLRTKLDEMVKQGVQWTEMMNLLYAEAAQMGIKPEQIKQAFDKIPIHPGTLEALKRAHAAGAELVVLSDANEVAINHVLERYNIRHLFSAVITNSAHLDDRLLHIIRYHPKDCSPHGCRFPCAANMCKGQAFDKFLASMPAYDRIIYVGDSNNDYCVATRLRSGDLLLCRKGFVLETSLKTAGIQGGRVGDIVARCISWKNGDDILKVIKAITVQA